MKKCLLKVKVLFLQLPISGVRSPFPCTPIPTALLRACKVEARFKGTMEKPRHHLNSKSVRTLRINGLENTYDAIRNGFQASLGDSVLQIFTMGTQQEYHFRLESLRDTLFFSHSKKFYHDYPIISNFPKLCILLDQPI